ncbi:MAG: M15 family metallopeptidase [Treponema sp.]|nr:M15 family metallopeptidase [Treponema sp.]
MTNLPVRDSVSALYIGLEESAEEPPKKTAKDIYKIRILNVLSNLSLPQVITENILESLAENTNFIDELLVILRQDSGLWKLVDKQHGLPSYFIPSDIVPLKNRNYLVNWPDLSLRSIAETALNEMAGAARNDGIILRVTSGFRTYQHQAESFARNVRTMGIAAAEMVSARPGHSQHQLGLAVDFGGLTNAFARSPEGIWLANNAARFGFSLSYPEGYEEITGYSWESWHFRYVGMELAAFICKYFNDIQQFALEFIHHFVNY